MVAVHMVIRWLLILGYKIEPDWFGMVGGCTSATGSMPGRGWVPVGRKCNGSTVEDGSLLVGNVMVPCDSI